MTRVRVRVTGTQQVAVALRQIGEQSGEMRDVFAKISNKIKRDAIPLTPTQTGALARSLKANPSNMRASVKAGGSSRRSHGGGVYAPIAHWGQYTHKSKGPRPFLSTAAEMNEDYAVDQIEKKIRSIIRQAGLSS